MQSLFCLCLQFYVHSPFGFPDISNTFFPINAGNERYISLKASTTVAADALRRLTPKQRRCQFMDEPTEDMDSPVYNYNLCKMNCRKRFALEKCNCYPYFYGKSCKYLFRFLDFLSYTS